MAIISNTAAQVAETSERRSKEISTTYHLIENGIPPAPSPLCCMQDARGPSAIFEEALHVSFPVSARLPTRVHTRFPRWLGSRHGRHDSGNRSAPLVHAELSHLAEGLKAPTSSSPASASTEGCSCNGLPASLRRVARAAQRANQALSVAPIPLSSILKLLPLRAGPKATLLLQAMAAGADLCDLIADEIGSRAASAGPCRRCARGPRLGE